MAHEHGGYPRRLEGPVCWILSALVGVGLGLLWGWLMPPGGGGSTEHAAGLPRVKQFPRDGPPLERLSNGETRPWSEAAPLGAAPPDAPAEPVAHAQEIPLVLCLPFALLLGSIALMPFVNARFWHRHYPDFAFALGGVIGGYYLAAMGAHGRHDLLHALIEYYSFIALIGGLFVVSGGILIKVNARATPLANTLLLAAGAVLANMVGTTGASMLLIRPFMRMNRGRLRPIHVVMFIFIVSNCAGCLTPIGDPPLYLGFLKGVPFLWTLKFMWPMWAACVGALLAVFWVIDARIPAAEEGMVPAPQERRGPLLSVRGAPALVCLVLIVAGVFIDPMLERLAGIRGVPIGATFQLAVAVVAHRLAAREIHAENEFNFYPVKEVAMLFAGIFLTMIPALGYLAGNAGSLGLESPSQFYFFTGGLSGVLDNAPTYLTFLQAALGVLHLPMDHSGIAVFIACDFEVIHPGAALVRFHGQVLLEAISLGAVFFGALTYIGNGPNFMVKSISEASGVRMPSFFAYVGYALVILVPVLVLMWVIFIR